MPQTRAFTYGLAKAAFLVLVGKWTWHKQVEIFLVFLIVSWYVISS
jgi:hypothetical protein